MWLRRGVVDGREEGFKPLAGSLMDGHEFGFQCAAGLDWGLAAGRVGLSERLYLPERQQPRVRYPWLRY